MKTTREEWKALVPPAKHDAVADALRSVFGTTHIQEVVRLTGGGSPSVVLRFAVNARHYVIRIVLKVYGLNDPVRHYACLNIASEAGITPRVHYTNVADGVSITDFVAAVPVQEYPGSLLVALVDAIKAIQETPTFPTLVNFLDGIDSFIELFRASGMLPEPVTREHFRYYARIQEVYPRYDGELVSSHNDLNPRNILFDGNRFWVIDWETAFRNDRYADLASVANFFFRDEPATGEPGAEEEVLLRAYFGDGLDEYHRARFFLMRQVCHMYYAMLLMLSASGQRPNGTWDDDRETPRLREFHRRFASNSGQADPLGSAEGVFLYGKVWLNDALHNMKTPRFAKSLQIMSERHRLPIVEPFAIFTAL